MDDEVVKSMWSHVHKIVVFTPINNYAYGTKVEKIMWVDVDLHNFFIIAAGISVNFYILYGQNSPVNFIKFLLDFMFTVSQW